MEPIPQNSPNFYLFSFPLILQGFKHDAKMAKAGNFKFRISDVSQHNCWPDLQRFESVSNFPVGFDEL